MAFLTKDSSGGSKKMRPMGDFFPCLESALHAPLGTLTLLADWRHNIRPLGNLLKKSSFANLTKPQIAPENEVKHTL